MNTKLIVIVFAISALLPQHKARSVVHVESLEYPPLAWAARIQGEVIAIAEIGADGQVRRAGVTSGHPLLGEAAVNNLNAWKFEAGEQEEIEVTYKFLLKEPKAYTRQTICKFDLPNTVTVISNLPLPDH